MLLGGTRVDAEFVAWLESGGHGLAALPTEQRGRSARLLDAQLATVRTLITTGRYDEPTGRRLHRLAASLATTSGWHRFDQGRHPAAGRRWELALQSAHRAGDHERAAGVLADAAYQATWLGRPAAAADRLDYALTATLHPTARALLLLRRARAHAARHDPAACRRDLAAAERALATPSPDPAPAWCAWMGPADLAVDSGGCLLDLGHPAAARTRITEGLAQLPPARARPAASSSPTRPAPSCAPARSNRPSPPPPSPSTWPPGSAPRAAPPWPATWPRPSARTADRPASRSCWSGSAPPGQPGWADRGWADHGGVPGAAPGRRAPGPPGRPGARPDDGGRRCPHRTAAPPLPPPGTARQPSRRTSRAGWTGSPGHPGTGAS
ncbi:hypothetical protein [Kitasatospora fiedleri]|uniref:hypothetical protein n=1 Tax=Kitasatospora fiedleri TaxID=2991545 RepID=UPI00249A28BA|nr:hypothetical protein [Kitasatospora fiedleri]